MLLARYRQTKALSRTELRQVTPHLQSYKKRRAQLILDHYLEVTPRNGKYTPALLAEKEQFESRVMAINASSDA